MTIVHFKKILFNPLFRYFFIPLFLICLFLSLVFLYVITSDLSFTTLSNFYSYKILTGQNLKKPLKKGEIIKGEFTAKENNLGIVAIAFDPHYKTWDDVIFRIKKKGEREWYFSNKFWAPQFLDFEYFSFGFPIIRESKNKIYQFEIKSLVAKEGEGLRIRKIFPSVVIKYQFNKNELLENKISLVKFLFKKFLTNFYTPNFIFIFFVTISPLFLYLIYLFNELLFLKLSTPLTILFLLWDILLIRNIYFYINFLILILLFINFEKNRLLFYLSLFLLFFIPLTNILNFQYLQYKVSLWFILILIIAVIQNYLVKFFFSKRRIIKS